MVLKVSIEADVKAAERRLYGFEKQVIPKATNRALNTTARNVQTVISRDISKNTGLKVGEVKRNTTLVRSSWATLFAIVKVRRRAFNLIRFVSPGKQSVNAFRNRRGVSANPWRKRRTFEGAFIIRGQGHGRPVVVARKGKARYPLKGLYGPSLHVEFNRPRSRRLMSITARRRFRQHFRRDLAYYAARAK